MMSGPKYQPVATAHCPCVLQVSESLNQSRTCRPESCAANSCANTVLHCSTVTPLEGVVKPHITIHEDPANDSSNKSEPLEVLTFTYPVQRYWADSATLGSSAAEAVSHIASRIDRRVFISPPDCVVIYSVKRDITPHTESERNWFLG
jgi:hypothetical protein